MSNGFPPLGPPGMPSQNGGSFAPPSYGGQFGSNSNAAPTSRAAEWIFNQSGMVVILALGLLGVWYVGRDHLEEFKVIRAEEKTEAKAERAKFLSALEACCKDRERGVLNGFSGN